jgi:hypothetical protein
MPGTFRWSMMGTTLIAAPNIEQIPVAARPSKPISRARVGGGCPVTYALPNRRGGPAGRRAGGPYRRSEIGT